MADDLQKQVMGIFNGLLPDGGPRAYRHDFDFTALLAEQSFDLYKEDADGTMKMVQAVYIDNSQNANPVELEQIEGTRFFLKVKGRTQGVYPILATKNPKFKVRTTAGAVRVTIHFLNVPIPFYNWDTQ